MSLGGSLLKARKKKGLSQAETAEKLGISRQTVSKWECDETVPDIRQCKKLSVLYGVTLDELVDFDPDVKEIEKVIEKTTQETQCKVDRTKVWGKKYPILLRYREEVDCEEYAPKLSEMLRKLQREQGYSELDAFLVLKDILGSLRTNRKKK